MKLHGSWLDTRTALLARWSRLSDEDLSAVDGERGALLRLLKARYGKTYGELEREVNEFELREVWAANMARPSLGITND